MDNLRSYEHFRQHIYNKLEKRGYEIVPDSDESVVGKQLYIDEVDTISKELFFKYMMRRKKKVYESDHKYISVIDHLSQLPIIIEEERKIYVDKWNAQYSRLYSEYKDMGVYDDVFKRRFYDLSIEYKKYQNKLYLKEEIAKRDLIQIVISDHDKLVWTEPCDRRIAYFKENILPTYEEFITNHRM